MGKKSDSQTELLITKRKEYTSEVVMLTKERFRGVFVDMYKRTCKTNRVSRFLLRDFQMNLKDVATWNVEQLHDNCKRFDDVKSLPRLLYNIHVVNIKLFTIDNSKCKITLPKPSEYSINDFVSNTCLFLARELWKKPHLLYDKIETQELMQNLKSFDKILVDCIKLGLRKLIPLDSCEEVVEELSDSSNDDDFYLSSDDDSESNSETVDEDGETTDEDHDQHSEKDTSNDNKSESDTDLSSVDSSEEQDSESNDDSDDDTDKSSKNEFDPRYDNEDMKEIASPVQSRANSSHSLSRPLTINIARSSTPSHSLQNSPKGSRSTSPQHSKPASPLQSRHVSPERIRPSSSPKVSLYVDREYDFNQRHMDRPSMFPNISNEFDKTLNSKPSSQKYDNDSSDSEQYQVKTNASKDNMIIQDEFILDDISDIQSVANHNVAAAVSEKPQKRRSSTLSKKSLLNNSLDTYKKYYHNAELKYFVNKKKLSNKDKFF